MQHITESIIKSAALGGTAYVWANFTLKAFKMARHIVFSSPESLPETLLFLRCNYCGNCFLGNMNSWGWFHGKLFMCVMIVQKKVSCVNNAKNVILMREKN